MLSNRPAKLIGVVGTHTGVGKTYVAAKLLSEFRVGGLKVAARKPVQSFDLDELTTDAQELAAVTGEEFATICPPHRNYGRAMAPPMAADVLGCPKIILADLVAEIFWPKNVDIGLVETVGGLRSPISHDGDSVDLISKLRPDYLLVVGEAGLGALNAIRLTMECIAGCGIGSKVHLFLNRYNAFDELHRLNLSWLRSRYAVETSIENLRTALIPDAPQ